VILQDNFTGDNFTGAWKFRAICWGSLHAQGQNIKIPVGAGAKLDRDGSKLDSGDGAKLDFRVI
jgi:hypothetical protein